MKPLARLAIPLLTLSLHAAPAPAQSPQNQPAQDQLAQDQLATTLRSLDGRWQGTLEYRDFQSNERTTIPIRAQLEAGDLTPVLSRRVEFTDPGRTILSQDIVTITGNTLTEFNPAEAETAAFTITDLRFDDTYDWTLTLTGQAQDNGVPSAIKVIQKLNGNTLTLTRQVRPIADPNADWMFRNQISLERAAADAEQLLGSWQIDLRPSADAAPYTVTMNIAAIDDGTITGTFYDGSPIANGSISVSWGVTRFAFTTEDGSGTYHTSGTLRNGTLRGTTHSLGRAFLMEWNGTPSKTPASPDEPN